MVPTRPVLLLAVVACSACLPFAHPERCAFQKPPQVVLAEGDRLLQYWLDEERAVLFGRALPESGPLREFRDRVARSFDVDPRNLLAGQLRQTDGGDAENVRLALSGEAGSIRRINCLEALLLSQQSARTARRGSSMFAEPTEFLSYVMARHGVLKIYFYTVDQPGIGRLGDLHERLARDVAEGWTAVSSIHNHNFFPASERLLGGVVPSATDVRYFRSAAGSFGLRAAAITNGFHTIEITREDFDAFAAH